MCRVGARHRGNMLSRKVPPEQQKRKSCSFIFSPLSLERKSQEPTFGRPHSLRRQEKGAICSARYVKDTRVLPHPQPFDKCGPQYMPDSRQRRWNWDSWKEWVKKMLESHELAEAGSEQAITPAAEWPSESRRRPGSLFPAFQLDRCDLCHLSFYHRPLLRGPDDRARLEARPTAFFFGSTAAAGFISQIALARRLPILLRGILVGDHTTRVVFCPWS